LTSWATVGFSRRIQRHWVSYSNVLISVKRTYMLR